MKNVYLQSNLQYLFKFATKKLEGKQKDRIYPKASQIYTKIKEALKQRDLNFKIVVIQ